MMGAPRKPECIFPQITADYCRVFGEDLLSILLYGSGAGPDYAPGRSDLNFLVTLTERGLERLPLARDTVWRWRRRRVAVPLFVTPREIASSLDAYPVEFLSMQRTYRVVFGQDVLAGLTFPPDRLRLQLEREVRGKLFHLRSGVLAAGGRTGRCRDLIGRSLTALLPLFQALLHLSGAAVPAERRAILEAAAKVLPLQADVYRQALDIRENKDCLSGADVRAFLESYLREVHRLASLVDGMGSQEDQRPNAGGDP